MADYVLSLRLMNYGELLKRINKESLLKKNMYRNAMNRSMNKLVICFLTFITFILWTGCSTSRSPYYKDSGESQLHVDLPEDEIAHRLYLIGDAGGIDDKVNESNYVFEAAKAQIESDKDEKSLVFLGDNIYDNGLGNKQDANRKDQEKIINAHLRLANANEGLTYIIPGNHDWNDNKEGGLEAIKRQYEYVRKERGKSKKIKFYPKNGCGDPEVIKVNKRLVYIFIDSQWWVHNWSTESQINKGCSIDTRREFLDKMKDILVEHKNKKIMIMLHHPFISNGEHGGNFGADDHLFPLRKLNKKLWVPIPFIGSMYPLFRQLGGTNQDVSHEKLQYLKKELERIIRLYDVSQATFISGHDHLLQHSMEQFVFQKYPINYIISGSGYKKGYASRGPTAEYVQADRGYAVIHFYENGGTWLDFYTVSKQDNKKTLQYRRQLYEALPSLTEFTSSPNLRKSDQTITLAVNEKFDKGFIYRSLMGTQYRESWTTPVNAEVFTLNRYFGGLTPTKKGGGLFSNTLRLEDKDGKDYVLRSMNKDFFKAVPKNLQHLDILKLYSDQVTASIPYGALYIAELSEKIGIYHTSPKMVYLEDSSQLGPFAPYFAPGHYILEARPDGDWSDSELFGSSENIVGYNDVIHNLRKKTTHFIDQRWVLKSRLFDILIHDRDRHDDQWRWASFKENGQTIYRPVPRDRDWAFFKYGGLIPGLIGNVVDKKLKSFKSGSIDVKSLATNANNFDRYFLDDLTWDNWEEVIDAFLAEVTDEALESSILALPEEIRPYLTKEIIPRLKARKKILKKEVKKYYDFMAKEIDLIGTDEKDIFEINMEQNGDVEVMIYRDSKKNGKVKKHGRRILAAETEEIRLYGLSGKDKFDINIVGTGHPRIKIIGGSSKDDVNVTGNTNEAKHILVYDEIDGMDISNAGHIDDKRTDEDLQVNEYDRIAMVYDTGLPWLTVGVAPDEGFTFGLGFSSIKHAWRKSPFKSSHLFNGQITPGNRFSLKAQYKGEFVDLFGNDFGFAPSFNIETPDNINYFGLGENEYNSTDRSADNWVQLSKYVVNAHVIRRFGANGIRVRFGPTYEGYKIDDEDDPTNVLNVLLNQNEENITTDHFIGLESDIKISTLDRADKPSKGILIRGLIKQQYHTTDKNNTLKLGANFSWFTPLSVSNDITFGSNTGFETILGDPLFYQYPAMGNNNRLRPFRNERYRGETVLYQQFDVRFKLFNWNNSILPFSVGGIGGYDLGQSYFQGEMTGGVKHGWTAGLSYDLVNLFVLSTSLSGSEEGKYFKFEVGYAF